VKRDKTELLVRLLNFLERDGDDMVDSPGYGSGDQWEAYPDTGNNGYSGDNAGPNGDDMVDSPGYGSGDQWEAYPDTGNNGYSGGPNFQCDNGNMTMEMYVCDGDNDCGDCTDEQQGCGSEQACVIGQWNPDDFQCDNGVSVPGSYECDGDNDCGDCSDEASSSCESECDPNYEYGYDGADPDFQCDNGDMTMEMYVCDGDNDCEDCTDEQDCGSEQACVIGQWNPDDITCANGNGPFPASWECDAWNDCGDCSDEVCGENAEACEGTAEGDNFGRKRSGDRVLNKSRNLANKMRTVAEKREHTKHITDKRNATKRGGEKTKPTKREEVVEEVVVNAVDYLEIKREYMAEKNKRGEEPPKVLSKKTKHH